MGHDWTNVMWAAYITSAARVKLHQYICMQGYRIIYCDTDSILSQEPVLGIGEGLGSLTDHTNYQHAWIVGPKLYSLVDLDGNEIVKAKGVSHKVAKDFLTGKEVIFDSPVKPKGQFHRQQLAGTWIEISRQRGLVPHKRTPVDPQALLDGRGFSDTLPPCF